MSNGFFNPFDSNINSNGNGISGEDGRGIVSITFLHSNKGTSPGIMGAEDTYQILYTDNTKSTYIIKNGEKGERGEIGPKGDTGLQGPQGESGIDGISITNVFINDSGNLIITLNNEEVIDAGYVKGSSGRGVSSVIIDLSGDLIITYTDNSTENLGKVVGDNGENGLSAYQIWLSLGNDGSETDFIQFLQGENGNTPLIEKQNDNLVISYDNGNTWEFLISLNDISNNTDISELQKQIDDIKIVIGDIQTILSTLTTVEEGE